MNAAGWLRVFAIVKTVIQVLAEVLKRVSVMPLKPFMAKEGRPSWFTKA